MFQSPVVGVVGDAALFVGADLVTVDEPVQGGAAAQTVLLCFGWDAFQGDVGVVEDAGFVRVVPFAVVSHFLHAVGVGNVVIEVRGMDFCQGVGFYGFVVHVELGQFPAGLGEGAEVCCRGRHGDAGGGFGEVVGKGLAVLLGVEDAVGVVEEVVFGDFLVLVMGLEFGYGLGVDVADLFVLKDTPVVPAG